MKVSIITSCYNREATIRDAIRSVLEQDYPDIEYIIVDGASTDRTVEIIKSELPSSPSNSPKGESRKQDAVMRLPPWGD